MLDRTHIRADGGKILLLESFCSPRRRTGGAPIAAAARARGFSMK